MIINGGARNNRFFFAKHLMSAEKNETVRVAEIRGFAAKTPKGCFQVMEAISLGTKAKNYFYHANINPAEGEILTKEQWERAVDLLEEELGLKDQARFVVEHEKKGRVHRHAVWLRINVDEMKAIPNRGDYYAHQRVARQLEQEFGLSHVPSVLGVDIEKGTRPERNPEPWETFRGQESGIDVKAMKQEVTELWHSHQDGRDFKTALEARGYLLARGDSRGYCLVDQIGDVHSLARRLPKNIRVADIKTRLGADIPLKSLPHVKEASAIQRAKIEERDMEGGERGQDFVQQEEADYKAQVEQETALAKEMEAKHRQYEEFKRELDKKAEAARLAEEERKKRGQQREEGGIRNADSRYAIALGDHYNMASPYTSLARASMAEYSAFMRDRERLTRQIAEEKDPINKQRLELQRDIESAEYMAITSRRIGRMSEVTQGKEAPETMRQYERAEQYREQAHAMREEYRGLGRDAAQEKQQPSLEAKQGNRKEEKGVESGVILKVETRNPRPQPGSEQKLTDFVKGLPEKEETKRVTQEQAAKDAEARKVYYRQQTDDRIRAAAFKNISCDLKIGKNLSKDDIKQLSKDDLKQIREGGDQSLKDLVKQHDLERAQTRGRGR